MANREDDKKEKKSLTEDSSDNIDVFLAQFDEISNKFENKPDADGSEEMLGSRPVESGKAASEKLISNEGDTDSVSRTERLRGENAGNGLSVYLDRLIMLLAIVKQFFINIASKIFLEKHEMQEQGTGTDIGTGAAMARNSKRKKQKKYKINKGKLIKFIVGILLVFVLVVGAFTVSVILRSPKIDPNNIYSLLSESSLLYDSEGNIIDSVVVGDGSRTNVDFEALPEDLVNAFVAIEDKTFWEHGGFNYIRIFGAIFESVTSGDNISGTSTITQQLARNLYLSETKSDYSITRKISEAYYTTQLEKNLSKEQILEAYLNTIFLGYNSNGVQAASQAYFSKDVENLTLLESCALASLAKAPDAYALVKRMESDQVLPENENIIYKGDTYTYVFNDLSKDRRNLVLEFMEDQEYISAEEKAEALAINLKDVINPSMESMSEISSYFADYVIAEVIKDLEEELDLTNEEARRAIYNNGLHIYTTMDSKTQKIVETEFSNPSNFPGVTNLKKDGAGNIVKENGSVILYSYSNYFDEAGTFNLSPDEYYMADNGDLVLRKGQRLNFYKTEVQGNTDFSIEFKSMYLVEDGRFYNIGGGVIVVPQEFKSRDEEGNLYISAEFLAENPEVFQETGSGIAVNNQHYVLRQRVIQPQAAMVITAPETGAITAMVGGRETVGRLLFNRAISPRQPGSSMKPIAVYGPAIQQGANAAKTGTPQTYMGETSALYGDYWTPASVIDDSPLTIDGKLWPSNWYTGYRGLNTMRVSIEQSINVNAVKVFQEVGVAASVDFLHKLGITSLVESGDTNDMNAAALALGGMTKGISPLEMTGAYGAFLNQGKYVEPIPYLRVENKRGEVIIERIPAEREAMDKEVAFLMTDMLKSTVQSGIGASAGIGSQPVAGKTGTTTDNYDAWFVGFTPQYVGAIWIGNDVNIELTQGSVASSRLFSTIMKQVSAGIPTGSFPAAPENIISVTVDNKSGLLPSDLSALDPRGTVISEYFIKGTEPTRVDDLHKIVTICNDTGYLATPDCFNLSNKMGIQRPYGIMNVGDINYEAPHYYCHLHNSNSALYPVNPEGGTYVFEGVVTSTSGEPGEGNNNGNGNGNGNKDPEDTDGNNIPDWLNP